MFTGIVTAVGKIARAEPRGDGLRLRVDAPNFGMEGVAVGDSIAVQGVCLTVVARDAGGFDVDVSQATLAVTHGLAAGADVNLEKALRMGDRLDGHLVAGHVDGVGEVVSIDELGGSARLVIEAPAALSRFLAAKGSIAVDGVSLTLNAAGARRFEVNLIPFTRSATTLGRLRAGTKVNLEVDLLARYVERALHVPNEGF